MTDSRPRKGSPRPLNRYPVDHWIRDHDPSRVLAAYLEQQSLTYSRIKNSRVLEVLGDMTGKTMLDYGCGAGYFLVRAALSKVELAVGVEAEETALAAAGYWVESKGLSSRVELIHSHEFPVFERPEKFDLILMKDVIEHVEDDPGLVEAAARVLAPGGRLVLSTQNSRSLNYLIEGTWNRAARSDRNWFGWDPTHLRFYTPKSLEKLLDKAGLVCEKWRSVYLVPYKWPAPRFFKRRYLRIEPLSAIDLVLGAVPPFNRWGWNIIVSAFLKGK